MFEVNGTYANRIGTYTVLALNGRKMRVRYEDGNEADLNINIQERIWENVIAERLAAAVKATKSRKATVATVSHYIKTITVDDETFDTPGLKQRLAVAGLEPKFTPGDRLLYFSVEKRLFFAVATVTTKPKNGKAKDYDFGTNRAAKVLVYPIDVDAQIIDPENAIDLDSAELESVDINAEELRMPDLFIKISEDDFELLGEQIMEFDEEIEEVIDPVDEPDEPLDLEA